MDGIQKLVEKIEQQIEARVVKKLEKKFTDRINNLENVVKYLVKHSSINLQQILEEINNECSYRDEPNRRLWTIEDLQEISNKYNIDQSCYTGEYNDDSDLCYDCKKLLRIAGFFNTTHCEKLLDIASFFDTIH